MTAADPPPPLGHDEPEVPHHAVDPDRADGRADPAQGAGVDAVEDGVAYELAVEDGAPLPPGSDGAGPDGGREDLAPRFQEPGAT